MTHYPHPFIKSAGGKTHLLGALLESLPKEIGNYFEPFVGGGALFWELARQKRFKQAVLGDANADLFCAYRVVRSNPQKLIEALEGAQQFVGDSGFYYGLRARNPTTLNEVGRAVRFIVLNKTCFNGLWRTNSRGEMNTPMGKFKSPPILCDPENITACSDALRDVILFGCDFEHVLKAAKEGDLVYADPPYLPVSPTANFASYTKDGFSMQDQLRLCQVLVELDARGVNVIASNSIKARPIYAECGLDVRVVTAPRAINSKGGRRGPVEEILVTSRRIYR